MIATRQEIRRAAGRVILCGFDGAQVTPELREILREVQPLGLVLFARNVESPEQVAELGRELKSLRPEPLLLSVDQEGGRVARIRAPATELPPMASLGLIDDVALTRRVGELLGRELRSMNIDANFAPVLDVNTNPKNPVIGDRSFSNHAEVVARHGRALIEGLQGVGVAACGKHFPGHGDTHVDSHLDLPLVEHELERLREIDWPPFRAAIEAGVSAIMTAHVVVAAIDEKSPATLSDSALRFLREELGFTGAILSDDLEMKAIADRFPPDAIATRGLNAGIDIFLACHDPQVVLDLYRAVIQSIEREEVTHDTLLEAEQRAVTWRRSYWAEPVRSSQTRAWVGCTAHQSLLQEIHDRLQRG